MKRLTTAALVAVALLLVGGGVVVWRWPGETGAPRAIATTNGPRPPPRAVVPDLGPRDPAPTTLTPAEKTARVDRIRRDYDEVRTKAATDYAAAGMAFPGGLNAFLRQLALLERELHHDYAAVLAPRELEDLEKRETSAGQLVQRLLGDTVATDEQRRAAFRLQREFDDRFALTFDTAAATLLIRETERQATQEKIRLVIGDALFPAWLRGEGADYANFSAFVAEQGLIADTALGLWRAKNDYTLRRLALNAQQNASADEVRTTQATLAQNSRAHVLSLLGPVAFRAAGRDVLGWLPPGK